MAKSIRKEDRELKAKKAAEKYDRTPLNDKPRTEEEHQVSKKVAEKKISKSDAKKEVAKENVKKKTGYDVETLAHVAKEVLETGDAYAKGPVGEAMDSMVRIKGNAVDDMLTKMAGDKEVAQNILKAGLGSNFLSTGELGIQHGAKTVLEEKREAGDAAGMQKMLCTAVKWGKGMSMDEIRALKVSPKTLKRNVKEIEMDSPEVSDHTRKVLGSHKIVLNKKRVRERLGKSI